MQDQSRSDDEQQGESPQPNRSQSPTAEDSGGLFIKAEAQGTVTSQNTEPKSEGDLKGAPPETEIGFDLRREARDTEKCLNVDAYADALAGYFEAAGDADMCFGLFGHWGRGKTFLVKEVAKRLELEGYATVPFSAWKYRTTPELWAYLYETIASAARNTMLFPWLLPIRFGLARYGIWPVIWAVLV